ncbi:MAG: DUF4349 domain-containing protein [Pyrinomonadaceae bacterium]
MKTSTCLVIGLFPLLSLGCDRASVRQETTLPASSTMAESVATEERRPEVQHVSLDDVDKTRSTTASADRKIVRNANLSLEVRSPIEAQGNVTSIAESRGGFVVASEAKQRESQAPGKRTVDIKLVVRVPSNHFDSALSEIEHLSSEIIQRTVTGQDITEEYIDIDARLKTQKALETQFLEIMKQASKVADALEVQRQIAEVRTDIEKLEGRKRFVENQSSLSTISIDLKTPAQLVVSTSGFRHTVREAISDSLDVASGIIVFLVRLVIVGLPILVFPFLPLLLLARYLIRRAKRGRFAKTLQTSAASD